MCINCTYRHTLIMGALFSRDVGALADFTLPPEVHANQPGEHDHRRSIGIIGDIFHAVLPGIEVMTKQVPQSVIDAERRVSQERLKVLYNKPFDIDGRSIPGGAVVSQAALTALYYAEMLIFAARQIEETVRQQARENPQYPGPRAMMELFETKRADLVQQLTQAATFTDGTRSTSEEEFPADMPEEVRDIIRRARAVGIPLQSVAVVAPATPVGTSPDGKLH